MNLRDLLAIGRRRWRLVALITVLGVAGAVVLSLVTPKTYTARLQMFVSASTSGDSASLNAYQGSLFTQQRVKSYGNIITSRNVAELVRKEAGDPRPAGDIQHSISASVPLDTVLLDVAVVDRDPARAQKIANAVGAVFPRLVESVEQPVGGGASPIKVSVVQQAELPQAPTAPRKRLNVLVGLVLGLFGGGLLAYALEALDTRLKSHEQLQGLTHAPVLGAISYDADAGKSPLVVVQAPSSPRAEAFRQLRTNLQFVDVEHALKSVVFTSSVPGEGKSTTTCNLAVTLAQAGLRVILVEADLRRPRVADYMGVEGAVGLTSVLLGRVGLDDALQPWGDGHLQVLASGPLPPNPSELLGSAGMRDLLEEMHQRADLVIFDAPPLLPVTDAAVLGTLTSGVVMLVRSGHTRREQMVRALDSLRTVSAVTLGTILNMVPTKGPDAYAYGYGYEYGYSTRPGGAPRSAETVLPKPRTVPAPMSYVPEPVVTHPDSSIASL